MRKPDLKYIYKNLNPDNNLKDKNIDINNENNKLTELNSLIISK